MTPHLTREELVRWRDQGPAADRERTVAHLAECDACGAAYSELLDTAPAAVPPARPDTPGFVARGIALGPGRRRAWPLRRPALALAASIAALALSAALVPGLRGVIGGGDTSHEGDAVRSSRVLLVSPVGDVTPPRELAWRSPIAAASYRVELRDADRRPIGTLTTTEERIALPAELGALLRPGGQYNWTVTALDQRGEPLLTSRPETFRILASTGPSR